MRIIQDRIKGHVKKKLKQLETIPESAYDEFVKLTPIRSGNARSSTDFVKNKNEIQGNYEYANRLNTGWSRQAPKGMTEPTIDHIRDEIRKILK